MKNSLKIFIGILLFTVQALQPSSSQAVENPWSKIKLPAPGLTESIGSPSAGCIRGASSLEDGEPGYFLMRPSRGRHFGHPSLIGLIKKVATELQTHREPPLLLGDIGLPRGGPTLSAHASHQTGLDADIWYFRKKQWIGKKTISSQEREKTNAPSMVNPKKMEVNHNFGNAEKKLLRTFAESPDVDRILVNYAIKRELCRKNAKEPWILKIRPWFGHDHHFHVRMNCRPDDRLCRSGDPIPPGNGCDASLAWWWSEERKKDEAKNLDRQANPVMPKLPPECAPLASS